MYMQIQTLNISLPVNLVTQADFVAESEFKTRSELIKSALMKYINDKKVWNDLFVYGKKVGKKMGIKSEDDVNAILADYRNGR